jgi:hypothetical protein
MSFDDIGKENKTKKMSTPINFLNSWHKLSDWKHYTWKNHEAQSLKNKTLKDEIKKINKLHKMIQNKKIEIKRMRVKI